MKHTVIKSTNISCNKENSWRVKKCRCRKAAYACYIYILLCRAPSISPCIINVSKRMMGAQKNNSKTADRKGWWKQLEHAVIKIILRNIEKLIDTLIPTVYIVQRVPLTNQINLESKNIVILWWNSLTKWRIYF